MNPLGNVVQMNAIRIMAGVLAGLALALAARGQTPHVLNYQGRVTVSGVNFEGTGQFKFALVNSNGTVSFWSNDGSSGGGQPSVSSYAGKFQATDAAGSGSCLVATPERPPERQTATIVRSRGSSAWRWSRLPSGISRAPGMWP